MSYSHLYSVRAQLEIAHVRSVVHKVRFREDNLFYVGFFGGAEVVYIQHRYVRRDAQTGKDGWGYGRKWHVSPFATDSEIILTCLKAAITNAEHEVREDFVYDGAHIFQPHIDVNALAEASSKSDARLTPASEVERAEVLG